jgi:ribonuclease T
MTKMSEIYISVDIEASGPIPGEYSMLSLGACVVYDLSQTFYAEFKPISDNHIAEAVVVSGLSIETLTKHGLEPTVAMNQFAEWIKSVSRNGRPIFVAFNATFDWMFVCYYFHRFYGRNPFGISGLDIKAYYMGKLNATWKQTTKRNIEPRFRSNRRHTHNALDDALEQAELFRNILAA